MLLILAGGRGNRLGHLYKPLITISGTPLILHIISRFTQHVNEIVVCVGNTWQANMLAKLLPSSVRVVTDITTGYGPLAGIYTGLLYSSCELTYIAPADAPHISLSMYRKLEEFIIAGYDAAVPRWPSGHVEPLITAVRTTAAYRAAEELMRLGARKVSKLYALMRTKYVPIHYLSSNPEVEFLNLNRLKDFSLHNRTAQIPYT